MKKENLNLDGLKGTNPFKLPEGYIDGLTERIMSDLPEKHHDEDQPVSFMDHVRPWLYLAAVFAGLGLFFKAIVEMDGHDNYGVTDSLLVNTQQNFNPLDNSFVSDDQEYLEYIETEYVNYIMDEDMLYSE